MLLFELSVIDICGRSCVPLQALTQQPNIDCFYVVGIIPIVVTSGKRRQFLGSDVSPRVDYGVASLDPIGLG